MGIAFQTFFMLFAVVCAVLAIYKLRAFIKSQGFKLTVPIACLTLELIAVLSNFSRLFHLLTSITVRGIYKVDPLNFQDVLPFELKQYTITSSASFSITATLIIALYWYAFTNCSLAFIHALGRKFYQDGPLCQGKH